MCSAGSYGIGRIDMVENRVVGLKSREVYEGPAAVVLHAAHRELERVVLDRPTSHYKAKLAQDFATLIYDGLWFGPLRSALQAFTDSTQEVVTGEVGMRLSAGRALPVGGARPSVCTTMAWRPIPTATRSIGQQPRAS